MLFVKKNHSSIKRKLIKMSMATSIISVLLTCMLFVAYGIVNTRGQVINELSLLSEMISNRASGAIDWGDKKDVQSSLNDLKIKDSVRVACIYDNTGKIFASYLGDGKSTCPTSPSKGVKSIGWQRLSFYNSILFNGISTGTIYIESDIRDFTKEIPNYIGFAIILLGVIGVIAYILSSHYQRLISNPILHLVEATRHIVTDGQYNIRAKKFDDDEVGILTDSFNEMLGVAEQRDQALKEANETLEDQVKKRTEKLVESNIALEESNQEKEVAKQELEKSNSTLEKVNKDLEHAITLKDLWIANIGHEIRTPIHQIISMLQFAFADFESGKTDAISTLKYLKNGIKSSERLKKLIECLLDFEKLRSGKEKLNFLEADMYQEIRDLADILEPSIAKKNITLQIHEPTCNTVFPFDKDKISHVISNIISNAVKFSPNDAIIEVTVESAPVNDECPDGIAVSVRDQGVGIPDGEEAEIFETFVQSTKTYDGTGGTGLGLSISQEMVRLHHGRIFARNNGDTIGATFTFILPRHQATQGVKKNAA